MSAPHYDDRNNTVLNLSYDLLRAPHYDRNNTVLNLSYDLLSAPHYDRNNTVLNLSYDLLSAPHYDRNNTVLNLLGAPHYGLPISPRQCAIWETSIANKIIDNMEENDNCFIPPNLVKSVLVFHHIDNRPFYG